MKRLLMVLFVVSFVLSFNMVMAQEAVEEPVTDEATVEEVVTEDAVVEEAVEEPMVEEAVEEPVVEEAVEEPMVEEAVEEPMVEEAVEEPMVEEAVEEAEEVELAASGRDLVLGLKVGGLLPFGRNTKDLYDMGFPVGLEVKVPKLLDLGIMSINAGLEFGFAGLTSKVVGRDDLSIINVGVFGEADLSTLIPVEGLTIAPKVGLGYYLGADNGDGAVGISVGANVSYEVAENIAVGVFVGGAEILTSIDGMGGTSDYIDVRVGASYELPALLPF